MSDTAATERALLTALGTIHENWAALIAPTSSGGTGTASSDVITGLDRRVSLRHEVNMCLNGWARIIVDERQLTDDLPLGTDTLGLVEFLQRWARWFSGHLAGEAATTEISDYADAVRRAAAPDRIEWVHIGYCPSLDNGEICWGDVKAWPHAEPALAPFCQRCGRTEYVDDWERAMRLDAPLQHDQLIDFIREAFGREVTRSTLRVWLHRKVLTTCGVDETGQTLYDRGAVIYALNRKWLAA